MAALHSALSTLGPEEFSSVPQDTGALTAYLKSAFKSAQTIIDSVPLPPPSEAPTSRPRSQTSASEASTGSEITSSTARSDLLDPENAPLQKEWGKPLKLNAKDNPLGISAYKLGGKDGKGAWFARRSVHEGMGFKKWKLGLEREFPETLEVQGGPGEGNIRGIGGERRVERKRVDGVGTEEVYHLAAQFPGPSAPRDFVTLLLTSSNALSDESGQDVTPSDHADTPSSNETPRHFMVISRPCIHSDCPPRSGFVRGQYESVEFIREVPRKPKRSASALDLTTPKDASNSFDKTAKKRNAISEGEDLQELPNGALPSSLSKTPQEARQRGKTISFAGPRGSSAKGEREESEDEKLNPVEWVMITRSDPGGSVPRFLVERGTPGSIVADAGKFLDWATKKEHSQEAVEALKVGDPGKEDIRGDGALEAPETNGHLAGLDGVEESQGEAEKPIRKDPNGEPSFVQETQSEGMMSSMANVAMSSIESYAPQAVINRLPGHQQLRPTNTTEGAMDVVSGNAIDDTETASSSRSSSPTASFVSFSSEGDHADDAISTESPSSPKKSSKEKQSPHEKEMVKLNERKRKLNEQLAKTKQKETKDREELTSREEERIRKAEEKYAREMTKEEERYSKQLAKLEAKKRKTEDKDERTRLTREKEELRQQLESVRKERDLLRDQVGALQKENTSLVVRLGKLDEGKELLKEVKAEVLHGRSRSSSLRRMRPATPEKAREATVLGKGSTLKENQE